MSKQRPLGQQEHMAVGRSERRLWAGLGAVRRSAWRQSPPSWFLLLECKCVSKLLPLSRRPTLHGIVFALLTACVMSQRGGASLKAIAVSLILLVWPEETWHSTRVHQHLHWQANCLKNRQQGNREGTAEDGFFCHDRCWADRMKYIAATAGFHSSRKSPKVVSSELSRIINSQFFQFDQRQPKLSVVINYYWLLL